MPHLCEVFMCGALEFLELHYFIVHARYSPMHVVKKQENGQFRAIYNCFPRFRSLQYCEFLYF